MLYHKINMDRELKDTLSIQGAFILFILFTIYWLILKLTSLGDVSYNLEIFSATYGLTALWGGVWGLIIAKDWGFFKSYMGKAVLGFALGLIAQELGQIIYSLYSLYWQVEIPYPSIGDIGFLSSVFLYIYGVFYLSKSCGIDVSLKNYKNKISAIFIPLTILGLSYIVFLRNYSFEDFNILRVILDFGYPLSQSIYISIALLTYLISFTKLGGIMRSTIMLILMSLMLQYIADYVFLYKVSRDLYLTAGLSDYLYLLAYASMAISLTKLSSVFSSIKSN